MFMTWNFGAAEFEVPAQDVGEEEGAEIPDVGVVVDGRAAGVEFGRWPPARGLAGSGPGVRGVKVWSAVGEGVVERVGMGDS